MQKGDVKNAVAQGSGNAICRYLSYNFQVYIDEQIETSYEVSI